MKAEFGSRVIVNRGTENNPYHDVYFGADFGKRVIKKWLENEVYAYQDLSKNIEVKHMKITGRVKIKRFERAIEKNLNGMGIILYLIKVGKKNYFITRSKFCGMSGLSPVKVKRFDATLDSQNGHLFEELDECRANNEHFDTREQLTSENIENMPWFSLDTIITTRDDKTNVDKDDNEVIQNMVPQNTSLKRKLKPKAV